MTAPRGALLGLALGGLAAAFPPGAAEAQADSTTIVPGARYSASPLQERLLGRGYREAWIAPVRVPTLDLAAFAGGLTPLRRGGGQQTLSLRLLGGDGREYNFRSVDKEITQGLPADLRETLVDAVLQDQVSALHPAAAVVATGLLDAVGVLNPGPRLVVLPDDPGLGEYRAEFGGLLGTIELQADEAEDGKPDFAGAAEVDGAEDVLALLRRSPEHRADARAYLAERLVSLLMGDWDRHAGQYRWARFDSAGTHRWVPVPEDRDFAFSDYDGRLIPLVRSLFPEAAAFRESYPDDLGGLTQNSRDVDRLLLGELSWPAWEESVARLRGALTDERIEAAVRRMPPELFRAGGPELVRVLRARRDALPLVAERFYRQLADAPELHGTDAGENAEVVRLDDGSVTVTLRSSEGGTAAGPRVARTFSRAETEEIRLYLHGGDDVVLVRGVAGGSIPIRVVGGAGADTLRDRSAGDGPGAWVAFHDSDRAGRIEPGPATVVDRSPYDEPLVIPGEVLPPRDRGGERAWFTPWVGYEGTEGVIVGGGPAWTWYGFRRVPHAGRLRVRAMYGLGSRGVGVDASGEFLGVGSRSATRVHARASGLEAFRFHGLGNATPDAEEIGGEVLRYDQYLVQARLHFRPVPALDVSMGAVLERLDPDPDAEALGRLAPGDAERYGKAGLVGALALDTRPDRGALQRGLRLAAEGHLYPAAWDLRAPFGRLRAEAAGYAALGPRSALAARAGAAQLWGDAPLLESVSLGGSETLRGLEYRRYAGDALVYAGLETRTFLTRARLLVNGDLGVLAFVDAGRVYVDGVSEGGWHTGRGAGVWFETLGRAVSATYARGDGHRVYLRLGLPF